MKKLICLLGCGLTLALGPAYGQQQQLPFPEAPEPQHFAVPLRRPFPFASTNKPLVTFSLDFQGGGPVALVKAIEAASGKPMNVVINKQDEDVQMPPLKLTGVNVAQLFEALDSIGVERVYVRTSSSPYPPQYTDVTKSFGFKTIGEPTENSIWYFHVERLKFPPVDSPEKVCRFYSLGPYLERGFSVDDITTAIQTGWKMSGDALTPELNYHKETKLLIAFGDSEKLKTIDDVLKTLPSTKISRNEIDEMNRTSHDLSAEYRELSNRLQHLRPNDIYEQYNNLSSRVQKLEAQEKSAK